MEELKVNLVFHCGNEIGDVGFVAAVPKEKLKMLMISSIEDQLTGYFIKANDILEDKDCVLKLIDEIKSEIDDLEENENWNYLGYEEFVENEMEDER